MTALFWIGASMVAYSVLRGSKIILEGKKLYESQQDKEKSQEITQETESPSGLHANSPNRLVQLLPLSRKETGGEPVE